MKKIWYIHTVEHKSAIKRNEKPFAAIWTDLETVIPSQKEKDKYHMWNLVS